MTAAMKEEFDRQGYFILKQLYSQEEVQALKAEAAEILARHDVDRSGVFLGLTSESELFKEAAQSPALTRALKAIIGDYVLFMNDKVVFKNASTDFGSPWHQDYSYWHGSHKFSVWIALDDATPANGCLRVLPGSHRSTISHDGDAADNNGFVHRLNEDQIDASQVVDFTATKGDAIVFHDLLLHASYSNTSGADRWALISTYKDGTQPDPEYPWAKAAFALK
ncbi:phytanoyl-CoA dioxygenase family protein [Paenibacillus sp. CF384]|uniref:phytanoyl-CoA dioxygenase family protein n=1 Tax=Paenibacillus sp. CF384 TaxID=1884382 RepID=UPI00089AAEF8|nr:phytanoyl-CoA dioxygenase family protein [Paenibacillus sp. CF384]SDX57013.1 Ectoine hydroxylase-related dioxygenase, phytanoyl-CoA dioxygenase (PhyH) family [Paenibacillus sp. CF384]